ncbi:hypothetical protein ALI144C_35760 [Actinosynnema sp. ALI-1.44]|uniref:hypothetical protein n=1 Tax=Actinosynnema sp. ALI-1.44 TaxID=1933779 RepID=UPI00097CAAF3|nr:hypothetical protein [Actinosynnema sp. ALI-1.44]ONI76060.1 hypothetical protein ALI144C_35760 [Actinosynnema sp. ALI-1.44]
MEPVRPGAAAPGHLPGWLSRNYDTVDRTEIAQAVCANGIANRQYLYSDYTTVAPGQIGSAYIGCPAGKRVLSGGGFGGGHGDGRYAKVTDSYPDGGGWRIYVKNDRYQAGSSQSVRLVRRLRPSRAWRDHR